MKHNITFSVIAAAALASCTQNEDFTSQYNENAKTMKFDVAYVGKNTRATGDITSIDNKKFILWGAAYQRTYTSSDPSSETYECSSGLWITNKEPLTFAKTSGEGASGYWEVDGESEQANKEVAYPGSTYRTYFTAIAPSDEFASSTTDGKVNYSMGGQKSESTTTPTSSDRKLTLENIPVVQEIDNTDNAKKGTDYLIACQSSISEEVALTFKHLLSKLRFAVWTDENTAEGDAATTKIELNSLKIYLPKSTATAKYVQKAHDAVAGDWTWSGFTAADANPTTTGTNDYQLVSLTGDSEISSEVKAYSSPTNAHDASWTDVKVGDDKQFFIAPTESTSANNNSPAKLFIDIKYTVMRKLSDGSWSTTDQSGQTGYSAGHKVVTREKMLVPIGDSNYGHGNETEADPDNRNEGLSHFHQGTLETLYICLRADQKVAFSTEFKVNEWYVDNWVDDPIDINQ